jgi:uncharacterized membrane protein YgaE (UPF0421/DUF939 family)
LLDRFLIACFCAAAGALLGLVIALMAGLLLEDFKPAIVGVSALFCAAVGALRGVHAGEFAGEALGATASAAAAAGDVALKATSEARTGAPSNLWLWVLYCIAVGLAALMT